MMTIAPGDAFLATPGYRQARRWAVGSIPPGGLVPGNDYWVLSDSGVVGELISHSPLEMQHLGRVRYLGAVCGDSGETLNIRQFRVTSSGGTDHDAPVYLIVGTSSEVGKTTAGVAVLRALRMQGHATVIALKATGTSSFLEIARYLDFGAAEAFDCIDFGFPTTYPVGRREIIDIFCNALDFCLSLPADALVVECAGDPVSANAPELLDCLKARRSDLKIILAAADALGAVGAKRTLAEIGLAISLITGPCTDTPILCEWTASLCGLPAIKSSPELRSGSAIILHRRIGMTPPRVTWPDSGGHASDKFNASRFTGLALGVSRFIGNSRQKQIGSIPFFSVGLWDKKPSRIKT